MAMYELDGNHLLPVRLGRSADAITLSHSLVAIQRQIVDVLRRPLFPLSWEELETGASLTALDATGQVVVVEVLERVDSTGLLAAMSRLTQAATAGRREIASRYAGGLGAFSQDWNEFREAMPAQVEAGPRLTILSASLEPDVVGGLGVLASSGLEIHEVDVRIVDESRIVVVVEKISGLDVAAGGPLLVARAPRPALAGSASAGSSGSRAVDATEQAEHMSPVTGPIEIVIPTEPAHAPDAEGADDTGAAIPAGAFAATGAADALSELFEPVAVTAEQPLVHTLASEGGAENQPERTRELPESAGNAGAAELGASGAVDAVAPPGSGQAHHSADLGSSTQDSGDDRTGSGADIDRRADDDSDRSGTSRGADHAAPGGADPVAGGGVGRDLADILSGDALAGPVTVGLGEEPDADGAGNNAERSTDDTDRVGSTGRSDHVRRADTSDGTSAEARAVAALAGGVDILGGSSLSDGSGSAASAGSSAPEAFPSVAGGGAPGSATSHASAGSSEIGDTRGEGDSRTRMGRRSRTAQSPSAEDKASASPTSHAATSPVGAGVSETGGNSVRAAEAWSTVAPNEARPEAPTGAVPLVSWEPLRGSADALDPVAEALGGDPSKSLLVQETAELAAVAAALGEPTQIIWQRLRRGIYHEATLSVEGVITLSDGRSFTDPTSAANAAQDVTDADGWRVWRVGVHGAHLGDLRDDLADRSS